MESVDIMLTAKIGPEGWLSAVTLSESFRAPASSLEAVLAILQRFHRLAETIRDEQAGLSTPTRKSGAEIV